MSVDQILESMAGKAFKPILREAVCELYRSQNHGNAEKNYRIGMERLKGILSKKQQTELAQMEAAYEERRFYSAEYGFKCGLYGAFRQLFAYHPAMDGGFQDLVADDLLMQPKMQRHHVNYANIELCNQIDKAITDTLSEEDREHMVSVACALHQRVYSAAMDGFYCGYRAAYEVLEAIHPLVKVENIDKILTMEYHLGYIKSYADMERVQDNAA